MYEWIGKRFHISTNEATYLFQDFHEQKYDKFTTRDGRTLRHITRYCDEKPRKDNKEEVLNRIRKFIYYHLKKREFCIDERGISEQARKVGHVNFNKKAKELVMV